ncbi:MAG: hypothetical protein AAF845_06945 [Bacteroidota bacterium]
MPASVVRRALAVLAVLGVGAPAAAQGGFQTLDPSYGGETARRAFYGGFAVSGEAAYRDGDLLGVPRFATAGSDLALAARLDYALLPQVDVAVVADLMNGVRNGSTGLSWVIVKPYWRNEMTDYAVRVAVDPASEGGLGFRQTDVTFLSTTALSPAVTSDLTLGVRRVRTGYVRVDESAFVESPDDLGGSARLAASGPERERLVGQEVRASWGYNVLFDPAGSRLTLGLAAEAGDYAIVRSGGPTFSTDDAGADPEAEPASERIRSGIGWMRMGMEFSRPDYQLAPFVSLPVVTWADVQGDPVRHGPRPEKVRFGLRVTLR